MLEIPRKDLKNFLDEKVGEYNQPEFIENDPITIPHSFTKKQDIEISGFWSAILAWGQRRTIIRKCGELLILMDNSPYEFILNHKEKDLKRFLNFRHRTFNPTDTLYFISFFKNYYLEYESLENAFIVNNTENGEPLEAGLKKFHELFFNHPHAPQRTRKHISTPAKNSACKRLNMFLRWMVRKDDKGVDFGIWNKIQAKDLIAPCDLHVDRVARRLNLISRKQTDWKTALELTYNLRKFDPADPVKYDFALFGLGIEEKF